MVKLLNRLFLILGSLLLIYGGYLLYLREAPLPTPASAQSVRAHAPSRLIIPSLQLDLPIYPATIENGVWQTTPRGISHLITTPLPGSLGNSVLYGHNWPNLLGKLRSVKPGDTLSVTYDGGTVKNFTVHFVTVVTPDETHIYGNTLDHRLTLYTCTGFLDNKRLVVTAVLDEE